MPPNAAFRSIVGPPGSTSNLAKQLVSLEACKKLHELGELDDHLVPLTEESMDIDTDTADKCLFAPGMGLMFCKCCTKCLLQGFTERNALFICLSVSQQ